MDLEPIAGQAAVRDLARSFADREIVPHAAEWHRAG